MALLLALHQRTVPHPDPAFIPLSTFTAPSQVPAWLCWCGTGTWSHPPWKDCGRRTEARGERLWLAPKEHDQDVALNPERQLWVRPAWVPAFPVT